MESLRGFLIGDAGHANSYCILTSSCTHTEIPQTSTTLCRNTSWNESQKGNFALCRQQNALWTRSQVWRFAVLALIPRIIEQRHTVIVTFWNIFLVIIWHRIVFTQNFGIELIVDHYSWHIFIVCNIHNGFYNNVHLEKKCNHSCSATTF